MLYSYCAARRNTQTLAMSCTPSVDPTIDFVVRFSVNCYVTTDLQKCHNTPIAYRISHIAFGKECTVKDSTRMRNMKPTKP